MTDFLPDVKIPYAARKILNAAYTNNKTNDNNKNVTSASNNQQKTRA